MPTEDKFSSLEGMPTENTNKKTNISNCLSGIYFLIKQCISYCDEKENGFMANAGKLTEIMYFNKH